MKEKPAETLRTELPKVKQKSINITTKGIFKKLNFSAKWNIRDILRNKMRTFMGIAGITGCCMLLVCAFGMLDTMKSYIKWQFEDLYNFDYKIALKEGYTTKDYDKLIFEYGDATSQTLGVEVQKDNAKEANNIFVADSQDYVRFTNTDREYMKLQDNGVYVTQKLAKENNYNIGDKKSRVPNCPPEKEKAIVEAFKHFKMIDIIK